MKKRYAALICAAVIGSVLIVNAPAAWLAPLVKHYSQGTVSFAQSWGTVWQGSALLTLHRSEKESLRVPQALSWQLDLSEFYALRTQLLATSAALQAPVSFQLDGASLRVGGGQYSLPADSLITFGAPFNTLKPTGDIALRWSSFVLSPSQKTLPNSPFSLTVNALRMGLTGDAVLGDYQLSATPSANVSSDKRWALSLNTSNPLQAALQLKGSGQFALNGPIQFELESNASAAQASPQLQTLLNFLGRRQGDAYVLRIN
jgi:general secretion pathway protein N